MREARARLDRLDRLDRLIQVRQMAVDAAEARVREAEAELERLVRKRETEEGNIRHALEEFAHPGGMTGAAMRCIQTFVAATRERSRRLSQDIEKATGKLEERRARWTEARRDKRMVEKLRERRLLTIAREEETALQKTLDEAGIRRHTRGVRHSP